jgi:hypothetical protein
MGNRQSLPQKRFALTLIYRSPPETKPRPTQENPKKLFTEKKLLSPGP